MFAEEEWNDEPTALVLTQAVFHHRQLSDFKSVTGVGNKKSLLRTLQTLGSVPDWNSPCKEGSSDGETDKAPQAAKKKRVRKNYKTAKTEVKDNEEDEGPVEKKRKAWPQKGGELRAQRDRQGSNKEAEMIRQGECETEQLKKDEGQSKVSRKQWKNKMKNKRKCKNKYRQNGQVSTALVVRKDGSGSLERSTVESKTTHSSLQVSQRQEQNKRGEGPGKKEPKGSAAKKVAFRSVEGSGLKSQPDGEEIETSGLWAISARKRKKDPKQQQAKLQKILKVLESKKTGSSVSQKEEKVADSPVPALDRSSALRARMEQRLESARFRYINEQLYTSTSQEAYRMFQQDRQAFNIYHQGFKAQVERWPNNPVDSIISYIRNKPSSMVVADFGCGDCKIAHSVKNKVHSFDLLPISDLVTVCDMAHVPLPDGSVDIAIFCLSLMGTNIGDFVVEANRVLVKSGILMIAEVASRFENVRSFLSALSTLGFKLATKDTSNCYFYTFELIKTKESEGKSHTAGLELKPCMYKKR
uniref:Ribosomal RNA-processing protein 8 n=1 Tax=Lepisosteus oculatus TaxID=7918 RepID=W5MTK6_LEPOC|nr:PREDICTED: ribosomal RNA-processing protein 8 [Lepisosteus oculatus]XP_015197289.1 PREDICTED: ribosomal RNA-processing protein 8 [Lepisosteus oculatus]